MDYIDAHVHVWTDDFGQYPLADGFSPEAIKPPIFYPEDIIGHGKNSGVDRVVLVQMNHYGFDNSYMLDVMREYKGVFSGIAVIDTRAERPDDEMRRLAKEGVRGFRVYQGDPVEEWMKGAGYERMLACGAEENLAICPLGEKKAPHTDLAELIQRVYEAFGAERLMWASDCPYQVQGEHSYAASVELIEQRLDFISTEDRSRMLRHTAAEFFF